jgi:hypothetical protein
VNDETETKFHLNPRPLFLQMVHSTRTDEFQNLILSPSVEQSVSPKLNSHSEAKIITPQTHQHSVHPSTLDF